MKGTCGERKKCNGQKRAHWMECSVRHNPYESELRDFHSFIRGFVTSDLAAHSSFA